MTENKTYSVRLHPDQMQALKQYAVIHQCSVSDVIQASVEAYLRAQPQTEMAGER